MENDTFGKIMSEHYPETREEVISWFCDPHFRTGKLYYVREIVEEILDKLIQWETNSASRAWNIMLDNGYAVDIDVAIQEILERGLLVTDRPFNCWITREGKVYTCKWAGHSRLLDILLMNEHEAEELGWTKVSNNNVFCLFKKSREQIKILKKLGHVTDKSLERLKPVWKEKSFTS
ncbi:hypothetical protein [Caulobacter phage Cr30]|uniref:hypothetical protein n=1 Tax=Caulobacter phage Cr30 TaxID=1357714 RepID=UPI0004A9B420|nr:hypothetical protein OZ74_gp234 [Caulobacter phage Cr30]AGS81109.1 hypothetical protein [Caulobacter phage Cr30]